jgi:hypothetical protein
MPIPDGRPFLAKTRGDRLVAARVSTWVRGSPGRFRELFDGADVVSEGSVDARREPLAWYGMTSVLIRWPHAIATPAARAYFAALASGDPHVRLRAVRIARREAVSRAPSALGSLSCELRLFAGDEGLRIDVDVQAPLTLLVPLRAPGDRSNR